MTIPEQPPYTGVPDLSRLLTVGPWPVAPSQQKGVGGLTPTFPVPSSPGIIPSMYLDALHPKFPMMVLQTAVARGDGVTTVFTVTGGYEAGFLEVFINGLKQRKTTNFTETSASAGTFTMLQAPKTNDYIDVIFGRLATGAYCGLEFCDAHDSPAFSGSVESLGPVLPSAIYPGIGPYQRVYTAGGGGTEGAKFTYCDNIYAASPVHVAVNTGLPSSAGFRCENQSAGEQGRGLAVDPFNPNKAAMVIVNDGTAYLIYKNTNIRGGGSWASVFALADWNTLTGNADTAITIGELHATIAASGVYYAFVNGDISNQYRVIHTHDSGVTWTASAAFPSFITSIWVGQRNALLCYVHGEGSDGEAHLFHNLSDHHVWASAYDFGTIVSGEADVVSPLGIDDSEVLMSVGDYFRSVNSGAAFVDYAPMGLSSTLRFSASDPSTAWKLSTTTLRLSIDRALTYSNITLPVAGSWRDGSLLNTLALCIVRNVSPFIYTSPDWSVFTDRSGNLSSLYQVSQGPRLVAFDWTS